MALKTRGMRQALKQMANSPEENRMLEELKKRPDEPAVLPRVRIEGNRKYLEEIALRINGPRCASWSRSSRRANALADRENYLEQREAELRLAEGDLQQLRQLEAKRIEMKTPSPNSRSARPNGPRPSSKRCACRAWTRSSASACRRSPTPTRS